MERIPSLRKLMQQDVHRHIIKIVVNAQPATPAPTAGTVTQPTCATANRFPDYRL
jgi:hypothetical protein